MSKTSFVDDDIHDDIKELEIRCIKQWNENVNRRASGEKRKKANFYVKVMFILSSFIHPMFVSIPV